MDWNWLWSWLAPLLAGVLATQITSIIAHRLQESGRAKDRRVARVIGRLDHVREYMIRVLKLADVVCAPALLPSSLSDDAEHQAWCAELSRLQFTHEQLAGGAPIIMLIDDDKLVNVMGEVWSLVRSLNRAGGQVVRDRVVPHNALDERKKLMELAAKVRQRCDELEDQA